jgi:hypothetical protein
MIRGIAAILLAAAIGFPALAAPPDLISVRNSAASQPAGGNGDSVAPGVTPDGRFVLFTSTANNLTPGDNSLLRSDVFLRDRLSNTTTLVSVNDAGTGGGNGNSYGGLVSTNGRYVVFESDASDLVPGDTNASTDIFERDLQMGTTTLVSVATNGGSGNGASTYPVITPDGRYVAFLSFASNLVTNDTNGIQDVFVRDTVAGTTTLASVGATGSITVGLTNMDTPVITPDGRYVAFFSTASNMVPFATQVNGDVYVRDTVGGTTTCVSTNIFFLYLTNEGYSSFLSGAESLHPSISDDGRYVAFRHSFGQYYPTNTYVYDASMQTDIVVRVAGSSQPFGSSDSPYVMPPYNDDVYGPEITPDGRFIAYAAYDGNLHLWDNQMATDTVVSVDQSGNVPTNGLSTSPVFTPDDEHIAFVSTATNLVTNVISSGAHVYLRNLQAGVTSLVDVDTNGAGSVDVTGAFPSLSSNGQFVAFTSPDGSLVSADTNRALDVFVRDMTNGITQMISARNAGISPQSGNGISSMSQISLTPDGRWLAFSSGSSDLVTNDFNASQDVFVADLQTGSNILVSVGLDGNSAQGGDSGNPVISTNGRYVLFASLATNLTTGITNVAVNLFLRDLQAGTTTAVNLDTNGNLLGSPYFTPAAMSADGRYVAFAQANNYLGSGPIYWRDTVSNQTVLITNAGFLIGASSMSADGGRVAYLSTSLLGIHVWDSALSSNIYNSPPLNMFGPSLSPSGSNLAFISISGTTTAQLIVTNINTGSNLFNFTGKIREGVTPITAAWSGNERFVAFMLAYPTNTTSLTTTNDIYLLDLQAGTVTLVSANYSRTGGANNSSDSPVLSGDGRLLAYRSFASDIVPGITNTNNIFVFDRLTGSNTLLTAQQQASASWSSWVSQPAVSSNGLVAFQSYASGLASGAFDLNFVQDVFAEPQTVPSTTDSVGDGIPDWWRALYFGGSGTTTNSQSCATCDPDGDGMSNLQEYLAGTNPTNAASVFRLQLSAQASANSVTMSWPEVPGRSYQIQYKSSLTNAAWQVLSSPWVVGTTGSYTASSSPPGGYYRVVVVVN